MTSPDASRVTPLVVGLLLAVNLALAAWMGVDIVRDLPWISGEPGPTSDFIVHYGAGWMARRGEAAAYDEVAYQAALVQIVPTFHERMLWMHPPPARLLWTPFSAIPYPVAYLLWLGLSAVAYAWAAVRLTGHRAALLAAPLFAGFVLDLTYGQNGSVLTALLALGLLLLRDRPLLAALPLGYLTVKPHWAPMVLLALLVGRHWRALAGTVGVASALYLTSLAVFGLDAWLAFVGQLDAGLALVPHLGQEDIVSSYSAVLPLHPGLATAAQGLATLTAIGAVVWTWGRQRSLSTRAATLALALSVASPYLHFYDLAVLGIAVAVLARDALRAGRHLDALMVYTLATCGLWLARTGGALFNVQIAPLLLLLALVAVARRDGGLLPTTAGCTAP